MAEVHQAIPDDFINLNPVTSIGETPLCTAIIHSQKNAINFIVEYNNLY